MFFHMGEVLVKIVGPGKAEALAVERRCVGHQYQQPVYVKGRIEGHIFSVKRRDLGLNFAKRHGLFELKGKITAFIIDGIPVDFIAAYNDLTLEALDNSIEKSYGKIKVKVLRPEYLLAIALQTGRAQDLRKVDLLMEETALGKDLLKDILRGHNLYKKWKKYVEG